MLDSTWAYARALRTLPQLAGVPTVALNAYATEYWRPQHGKGDECLATIEAIYYGVRESWQIERPTAVYDGRFDGLLFWFRFFKETYVDRGNVDRDKAREHEQ